MFIRALNILLAKAKDGSTPIYPGKVTEVDDTVGREFIELKAAVEVSNLPVATANKAPVNETPTGSTSQDDDAQNGPETGETVKGYLDGADLESMSFADLKALAQDMGINTGKIRSKAAMIEAITSVEVEAPAEDEAPSLSVQDVIE